MSVDFPNNTVEFSVVALIKFLGTERGYHAKAYVDADSDASTPRRLLPGPTRAGKLIAPKYKEISSAMTKRRQSRAPPVDDDGDDASPDRLRRPRWAAVARV